MGYSDLLCENTMILFLLKLTKLTLSSDTIQRKRGEELLRDLDVGEKLYNDQRKKLLQLLSNHAYILGKSDDGISCCDAVEHRFITVDDNPVRVSKCSTAPMDRMREYLQRLLDSGIIR